MANRKSVDGSNVLYHYLQKDLYENDVWLFQMLVAKLVTSLAIWFRPSFYQEFPLLRPYAVRDATCRKKNNPLKIEQWGCPNEKGYFRDDNSLLKNLPSNLKITSPLKDLYDGKYIGNNFVASHIWRELDPKQSNDNYAARDPWIYSFVPNLVWLPAQVSKLTDRQGSFSQLYLQAVSMKIYRNQPVSAAMHPFVTEAWKRLRMPEGIPEQGLPEEKQLSYFDDTNSFRTRRYRDIASVYTALQKVIDGKLLEKKVISSRYVAGLNELSPENIRELANVLSKYSSSLEVTLP
ncbi:hypothetical protein ACFLX3_00290 [Chloroflexota bacterium]